MKALTEVDAVVCSSYRPARASNSAHRAAVEKGEGVVRGNRQMPRRRVS